MANISLETLRADILDRMDNSVIGQQMTESLRTKLEATKRVTHAMNQGLLFFMQQADMATISGFFEVDSLSPDTDVGSANDGVFDNVKVYLWPDNSFEERPRGGLTRLILNDIEFDLTQPLNLSLKSIRYHANSNFYGPDFEVYRVDFDNRRVYAPKDVDMKARFVAYPDNINNDDTYGSGSNPPTEIPLSDSFLSMLSRICFAELIKMGGNIGGVSEEAQQLYEQMQQEGEGQPQQAQQR